MRLAIPNRKQTGFAHVLFIVFLVVAAGIGSIAYVVYSQQQVNTAQSDSDKVVSQTKPTDDIPGFVEIKEDADIDKNIEAIDEIDPIADDQADDSEFETLSRGL